MSIIVQLVENKSRAIAYGEEKQIEELNAILESDLTDTASEREGKFDLTEKKIVSSATQVNVEILPCDHRFLVRV